MGNTVGSQLQEIIIGTLLGDGYLEQNGKYKRFVCAHSAKQKEYVKWKFDQLNRVIQCRISYKEWLDPRTNKTYSAYQIRSISSPFWDTYSNLFYHNDRRKIPANLPDIISAQVLAVWIMDDGYRRNDCNAMRLNTQFMVRKKSMPLLVRFGCTCYHASTLRLST